MKKIQKLLFVTTFSLWANCAAAAVAGGDLEVRLLGGVNFSSKFSDAKGHEYDDDGDDLGFQNAELKKDVPKSANIGFDANYFYKLIGANFGVSYSEFRSRSQNVYMNIPSLSPPERSHNFPNFQVKGFLFSLGPVFRLQNIKGFNDAGSLFEKITPYAGINIVQFLGRMNHVNYDPNDPQNGSTPGPGGADFSMGPSYGVGGHSNFNARGYMTRIGLSYKLTDHINLSAEYRRTMMRAYGSRMRSMKDGFTTNMAFDTAMLGIGYEF